MNDHIYLAHHGIKGQKWGVRRFQNSDGTLTEAGKKRYSEVDQWTYEGSSRTRKATDKLLKADAKYGANRTARQEKKIRRLASKADREFQKDLAKAQSVGNKTAAARISSGRTYLKMLSDPGFLNTAITSTAVKAKIATGERFTYSLTRNETIGGVRITVNDHSEDYIYLPNR